jgi:aminopeptidase N
LASFYIEHKYPATTLTNRKNEINYITSQPGGSVKVNDTTSVGRIFDGRLSYNKGSHLIYMLRFKLGDAAFFTGIRNYMKDPALAYGYARTNNLKQHLEQASGQDLTHFFNSGMKEKVIPVIRFNGRSLGSGYVRIKMNQTTSHATVPFFEMPVSLQFKNATQSENDCCKQY